MIFYIVLFIVLLLAAFFLSQYLFLTLEQGEIEAAYFMPHRIIASIAKNINHLTIFFSMCLLIIFGGALILNSSNVNNFEADMDFITDTIQTPKAVGQSQHGSQRWLKQEECKKAFACYTINSSDNEAIKNLIRFGVDDFRAVRNGKYEHIETDTKKNTEDNTEAKEP